VACPGIQTVVSTGVYSRLCIGILDVCNVFFTLRRECVVCTNGCVGLMLLVFFLYERILYAGMCTVLLSAGEVWNCG
jgi:hypothetical protein